MKKLTTASLAIAVLTLLPLSGYGQVLINDTFSLNGDNRTAGANLVGTSPEVGSGTYDAANGFSAVFGTNGGLVYPTAKGTPQDDLSGSIAVTPPAGDILSYSVTFNFGGSGAYNRLYIGLLGNGSIGYYGQGALLDNTGSYIAFDNSIVPVGTGTLANFSATATYDLELNYDTVNNLESLDINGVQVIAPTAVGSSNIGSTLNRISFFTQDPTQSPNMEVSALELTAVTAPEPSTYALLLAGLGLVGLVARKRWARLTL